MPKKSKPANAELMSAESREFIEWAGSTRQAAIEISKATKFAVSLSNEAIRQYSLGICFPTIKSLVPIIENAEPGRVKEFAQRMMELVNATTPEL